MRKRKGAQWAVVLAIVLLAVCTAGGHEPAQRDVGSGSELHKAARGTDREALAALLQAGADPNAADNKGRTPLHSAVTAAKRPGNTTAYGHVKELLKYGADPSLKDNRGVTPLTTAVMSGSEAIVAALIAGGGDPNQTTPGGVSLLALAEMFGNDGAAAGIRAAGGVHGSAAPEQVLVPDLPKMGEFMREMQMKARGGKLGELTPQELENRTVEAFQRSFKLNDDDPKVVEFRQKLRDKIAERE